MIYYFIYYCLKLFKQIKVIEDKDKKIINFLLGIFKKLNESYEI